MQVNCLVVSQTFDLVSALLFLQVELLIAMLSSVLVLDPSTWMMLLVPQVLANCWSVLAGQFQVITVYTLLMLVWAVKVISYET